jgi:hypothetical protein
MSGWNAHRKLLTAGAVDRASLAVDKGHASNEKGRQIQAHSATFAQALSPTEGKRSFLVCAAGR